MSSELKHRRGTAAAHASFIGAQGEITVKTDTNEIVVHDGVTPGGKTGGGYMPAGIGAVATTVQSKLREFVSVTDFYANGVSGVKVDPTGVVDSYLGIQAAINASKLVELPPGTYRCTESIDLKTSRLVGAGSGNIGSAQTRINFEGTAGFYSSTENNHGFQIEKMEIYGSGAKATNGQILIDFTGQNYPYLDDVRLWNSDTGVRLAKGTTVECNYGKFFRVDANQCSIGIDIDLSSPAASNSHTFYGGRLWDNVKGVEIPVGHSNIAFFGTAFEANDWGVDSYGTNITFSGCRFEQPSATSVRIRDTAGNHWFFGNHWSSGIGITDETTNGAAYVFDQLVSSPAGYFGGRSTMSPENLLGNGAFIYDRDGDGVPEPWISGFSASGAATWALVAGDIGGSAVQISNPTTVGNNVRLHQQIKVVSGQTYTLAWRAKVSAGGSWQMRVSNTSSAGTEYANVTNTNTAYEWKSVRFTATSNTLYVSIYLTGTTVQTVTADAVVLTQGIVSANGVNERAIGEYGGIAQENIGVAGGTWNTAHFLMGNYRLWVDSTGRLRIKSGAPTSDTDGTVVGTQT